MIGNIRLRRQTTFNANSESPIAYAHYLNAVKASAERITLPQLGAWLQCCGLRKVDEYTYEGNSELLAELLDEAWPDSPFDFEYARENWPPTHYEKFAAHLPPDHRVPFSWQFWITPYMFTGGAFNTKYLGELIELIEIGRAQKNLTTERADVLAELAIITQQGVQLELF